MAREKIADLISAAIDKDKEFVLTVAELIEKTRGGPTLAEQDSKDKLVVQITRTIHNFFIDPSAKGHTIIYLLHLLSILCTAVTIPLQVFIIVDIFALDLLQF